MRKTALLALASTLLISAAFLGLAFADYAAHVKTGDYIEYQVVVTGNPTPDFNITWARMNVTAVEGQTIDVDVLTMFANGTLYPEKISLNVARGALGDDFFIPTGLNVGDQFYDEYQGNITITSVGQQTVAGAQRTVVSGASAITSYNWDRQTGILVGANSTYPDYVMHTTTRGTNIWQPQVLGLDQAVFYMLIVMLIVVLAAIALVLFRRLKTLL